MSLWNPFGEVKWQNIKFTLPFLWKTKLVPRLLVRGIYLISLVLCRKEKKQVLLYFLLKKKQEIFQDAGIRMTAIQER